MGGLVEESIENAMEALKNQDFDLAQKVIDGDDKIDELEIKIEDQSLTLIATQQPMAKDLRRIATALTLINNLERIGDNANSIAKIVFHIGREPFIKPLIDLPKMARIAQGMVKNSLDSYVNENLELAKALEMDDDEVDNYHSQIFRELLTYMMENTENIKQATHLLFVSRYLERIADHATNIGEAVIYQVTGEREDLNRSTKNMKKKFNIKE